VDCGKRKFHAPPANLAVQAPSPRLSSTVPCHLWVLTRNPSWTGTSCELVRGFRCKCRSVWWSGCNGCQMISFVEVIWRDFKMPLTFFASLKQPAAQPPPNWDNIHVPLFSPQEPDSRHSKNIALPPDQSGDRQTNPSPPPVR